MTRWVGSIDVNRRRILGVVLLAIFSTIFLNALNVAYAVANVLGALAYLGLAALFIARGLRANSLGLATAGAAICLFNSVIFLGTQSHNPLILVGIPVGVVIVALGLRLGLFERPSQNSKDHAELDRVK